MVSTLARPNNVGDLALGALLELWVDVGRPRLVLGQAGVRDRLGCARRQQRVIVIVGSPLHCGVA